MSRSDLCLNLSPFPSRNYFRHTVNQQRNPKWWIPAKLWSLPQREWKERWFYWGVPCKMWWAAASTTHPTTPEMCPAPQFLWGIPVGFPPIPSLQAQGLTVGCLREESKTWCFVQLTGPQEEKINVCIMLQHQSADKIHSRSTYRFVR